MSDEINVMHRDIEQVISEMDDWIEVSALKDSNAWAAFLRRMDAIDNPMLEALKSHEDYAQIRWMQGYLQAHDDVRQMMKSSGQSLADAQETLAEKQREMESLADNSE